MKPFSRILWAALIIGVNPFFTATLMADMASSSFCQQVIHITPGNVDQAVRKIQKATGIQWISALVEADVASSEGFIKRVTPLISAVCRRENCAVIWPDHHLGDESVVLYLISSKSGWMNSGQNPSYLSENRAGPASMDHQAIDPPQAAPALKSPHVQQPSSGKKSLDIVPRRVASTLVNADRSISQVFYQRSRKTVMPMHPPMQPENSVPSKIQYGTEMMDTKSADELALRLGVNTPPMPPGIKIK